MRIRFITKNPLQLKYLALILASIMLPLLIIGGCLYYLIFQIMAEQLAIPESIAYNLIPVVEKINFLLIIGMPPIVSLLFIWGVILSHRLIGPLARLQKDLKKISDGDYSIRLKVRKNDDLRFLVDAINKIIDKLERR
ncbi:MAG: HAMP domain-containing protein [Candidatus Omnitrophota bacterium]|nr:MAG: HAMP domain-containing protein [Candidatus Omnitrophota bacterium]